MVFEPQSSALVFVGPSVPRAERPAIVDLEYCPPIRRGDLALIAKGSARPAIVGVIDGVFDQALAVSPREVLDALRMGIKVYGASSMGALRAAELWTMGMTGIGRVFELYRDEIITAEDEVAILFDADSETRLTEPLVNIRCALERALAGGLVGEALASQILAAAMALPYPRRSYREIVRSVVCDPGTNIEALTLQLGAYSQKKVDGLALIQTVARDLAAIGTSPPIEPSRKCG
jgi:hypothetical protein